MASSTFQFINSNDAGIPRGDEVRKVIRKQAMRHAADTRKRGRESRRGKLPRSTSNDSRARSRSKTSAEKSPDYDGEKTECARSLVGSDSRQRRRGIYEDVEARPFSLLRHPSMSGYESFRAKYGLDVEQFSVLTILHVGRGTINVLSQHPSQLMNLLRLRTWSYLSYLPLRYGHVGYLDDVVECVAARTRQVTGRADGVVVSDVTMLSLYAKALRSVQEALDNPLLCRDADTLCAVSMLSLFELLGDASRLQIWGHHVNGAAILLKQRGPLAWRSEYEKSLFFQVSTSIMIEALHANRKCFLEDEAWQAVFRSLVLADSHPLDDRSLMLIVFRMIMTFSPGVTAEVTNIVLNPTLAKPGTLQDVQERSRKLCRNFNQWHSQLLSLLKDVPMSGNQQERLVGTLGAYHAHVLLTSRLIIAVDLDMFTELEDQVMASARLMLAMAQPALDKNPHNFVFMEQIIRVASAVIDTHDEWLDAYRNSNEEVDGFRIMTSEPFQRWKTMTLVST